MKHSDSPDDTIAQLLAMKQELASLSFGRTARGTQQRKSHGDFAQVAPASPSVANTVYHFKRAVDHTLHRSSSDILLATDDPAERPALLLDHILRRSVSEPIKRVRFNDTVEVKHISPPKRVECRILSLRPTPIASMSSERHGVPALCSLTCFSLAMAVESSKGAGFDKVLANIPIGDLAVTLFSGRFDMFRVSYTKGGQDDHVYCCNPEHNDKTSDADDSSWMMEWLLVFQRTGVAVKAHSDACF
jgi:hypothetical protein